MRGPSFRAPTEVSIDAKHFVAGSRHMTTYSWSLQCNVAEMWRYIVYSGKFRRRCSKSPLNAAHIEDLLRVMAILHSCNQRILVRQTLVSSMMRLIIFPSTNICNSVFLFHWLSLNWPTRSYIVRHVVLYGMSQGTPFDPS